MENKEFQPTAKDERIDLAEEMAYLAEVLPEEVGEEGVEQFLREKGPNELRDILVARIAEKAGEKLKREFANMNLDAVAEAYLLSHSQEVIDLICSKNNLEKPLNDEEIIEILVDLFKQDEEKDVKSISLWNKIKKCNPFWVLFRGYDDLAAQADVRQLSINRAQRQLRLGSGRTYNLAVELINRLRAMEINRETLLGNRVEATNLSEQFHRPEERMLANDELPEDDVIKMWRAFGEDDEEAQKIKQEITR